VKRIPWHGRGQQSCGITWVRGMFILLFLVARTDIRPACARFQTVDSGKTKWSSSQGRGQDVTPPALVIRPEESARLSGASQKVSQCLALVGRPGMGHGTAFVISRKHRLLATAAHVADHAILEGGMQAVFEGTATTYLIERVWYHPGLVRKLSVRYSARSDDPRDGEVDTWLGPDVAVLQLAPGGPELPAACELAGNEDLRDLEGMAVGRLGYPGEGDEWPTPTHPAAARLATGRTTAPWVDLAPHEEGRPWIWHTVKRAEGTSGGPLFLASGRVVAVHSTEWYGWRVECLRELIAYHKLGGQEFNADRPTAVRSDWGPAPQLPQLRRAFRLAGEADELRRRGDYREAGRLFNEVLSLVPDFAVGFLQRGKVYLFYCGNHWKKLSIEERNRFATLAFADMNRCIQLLPQWPEPYLFQLQAGIYLDYNSGRESDLQGDIAQADRLLANAPLQEHERGFAMNCRAQARHFLGDLDGAKKDYEESIRLDPVEPRWRLNRAQYWQQRGRMDLAEVDRKEAARLRENRKTGVRVEREELTGHSDIPPRSWKSGQHRPGYRRGTPIPIGPPSAAIARGAAGPPAPTCGIRSGAGEGHGRQGRLTAGTKTPHPIPFGRQGPVPERPAIPRP
jgi:hypothetical protein